MSSRRSFLKYAVVVVVSAVVTAAGTWGIALSMPAKTVTVEKTVTTTVTVTPPTTITCLTCGSTYVYTPIGTKSENFEWTCLRCGYRWKKTYPEKLYTQWREAYLTADYVRDYTLLYLREIKGMKSLPDPLKVEWTGGRTTPEGLIGSETYAYKTNGVTVTINYPVTLAKNIIYKITIESQGKTVWKGQLFQRQFTQK